VRKALVFMAGAMGVGVAIVWGLLPETEEAAVSVESLRGEVDAAMVAKDWDRAIAILDRMADTGEVLPEDQVRRAGAELGRGHLDAVLQGVANIRPTGRDGARAKLLEGQVALRRHHLREAEELLVEALALDPELIQARRELVYVYGMREEREKLHEQFQAMARQIPMSWADMFLWCLTRASDWYPTEHVPYMKNVIAGDPADQAARLSLSNSLGKLGGFREAREVIEDLPLSDPNVRVARARVALTSGDLEEADRLVAEGPEDHLRLDCLRGQIAISRRNGPEAVRWFRQAIAIEPNDREAVAGMGRAYMLTGDMEAARPYLELSRKFDELSTLVSRAGDNNAPGDLVLALQLARACEAVGRTDEARGWTKLVIAGDPVNSEAQQMLYRLDHPSKSAPAP
jgi:tetratricopeptide (TPR) repeat protein